MPVLILKLYILCKITLQTWILVKGNLCLSWFRKNKNLLQPGKFCGFVAMVEKTIENVLEKICEVVDQSKTSYMH